MLVPLKWLRDYVDIDIDTQEFADMMTMTGSKVEKVDFFGKETNGVEVCKILEIEQHPDADRLKVTKVEVANGEILQIVTNATNIKVGDYVPVARIGAVLPGDFKIKKGKLRGVLSEGMFCGAEELTIPSAFVEDHKKDGIYILDHQDSFELGMDVRDVLGINDALIEFEITSNRPDCRSIIGIAREAAVTLGKELKYPEIKVQACDEEMSFEIDIQTDLCKRYCGRVVKDVKVGPSPYWMQRKLIEAGMRPISNIVDITKIDVGFTKPKFANCDIVRVIEEITLSVVNYAENKNINIVFDTEIEEHIIKCDSSMIERAMLNLLSNAIKFTKENGNIVVNLYKDEQWVHIIVKDDGIGIPIGIQGMIFERFVQGDKSLTRLNEGSGIGLSIVKSIVELNNGEIYLDSDGENGTEFEILLPNEKLEGDKYEYNYEIDIDKIELEFSDIYELYS